MDKLKQVFGTAKRWFKRKPKATEAERLEALIAIAVANELLSVQVGDLAFTVNPNRYQPKEQLDLNKLKGKSAEELKTERERLLFWSTK